MTVFSPNLLCFLVLDTLVYKVASEKILKSNPFRDFFLKNATSFS